LEFLWEHGERAIPRPVAVNRQMGYALYEYVDGSPVSPTAEESDIDQAVAFAVRLKHMAELDDSDQLPLAAEACFSIRAMLSNIGQRMNTLSELPGEGPQYLALQRFLHGEYQPALAKVTRGSESILHDAGMSLDTELGAEERTLSPSDFGFHNALKLPDGRVVFLDFEYFGWDDPAKMVSDFLLHPGMDLSHVFKRRFLSKILDGFQGLPFLSKRIEMVYPLFGLKWCLIMLNEFVPEQMDRRRFAARDGLNSKQVLAEQLAKARGMLDKVRREYEYFPYRV
jgi:thiamine kinase-like enzyme